MMLNLFESIIEPIVYSILVKPSTKIVRLKIISTISLKNILVFRLDNYFRVLIKIISAIWLKNISKLFYLLIVTGLTQQTERNPPHDPAEMPMENMH